MKPLEIQIILRSVEDNFVASVQSEIDRQDLIENDPGILAEMYVKPVFAALRAEFIRKRVSVSAAKGAK